MFNLVKKLCKRKNIATIVAVAVFAISVFGNVTPVKADVLQGLGTAAEPFIITTAERLASIPSIGLDKYYKLGNDIDLSTYGQWTPIGNSNNNFTGNFNGNGYKITGIKIGPSKYADTPNVGLFGYTSKATISNLGVSAEIYSSGDYIGCLAGYSTVSTITNCYSVAELNCTGNYVGGLLGMANSSNISGCHSIGTIVGTSYIGGLIGELYNSNLKSSYCTGTVSSTGNSVGGLIGYCYVCTSNNYTSNCYSNCNVNGITHVGGFIGYNQTYAEYNTSRTNKTFNCYATGNVTGSTYVGGFIGTTYQSCDSYGKPSTQVINCYSSGKIIGTNTAGGFAGYQQQSPTITKSYWCYTNSPSTSLGVASNTGSCDLSGLAEVDIKDQSFVDTLNYNIYNLKLSDCAAWKIVATRNNGLPVLDGIGDGDTTDIVAPSGSYTLSTTASTTGSVTINFSATDDNSGVKSITRPDGTVVDAITTSYVATKNGKYDFIVTDNAGNTATVGVIISKIVQQTVDITAPSGAYTLSTVDSTTGSVSIYLNAADEGSGVKSITLPDNTVITAAKATYTVSANGTYKFIITDNAGNTAQVSVPVTNIIGSILDVTAPSASYTISSTATGSVTIKVYASDDNSGVKSITLPDSTIINATTATYTVKAAGSYRFVITDKSGNNTILSVDVPNLNTIVDTDKPTGSYTLSNTASTTGTVTINFVATDEGGGVNSVILPNGSAVTASTINYTVSANGIYNFTVIDNAGNTNTIPVIVSNIDKSTNLDVIPVNIIANDGSNVAITINILGSTSISTMKWASGTNDIEYFKTNGIAIIDNSFNVNVNGTYTIYIKDSNGNSVIKTITVNNINSNNNPSTDPTDPSTYDPSIGNSDGTDVSDIPSVVDIVMSEYSSYAITATGEVYSWGKNNCGQLGIGNTKSTTTPTKISGLSEVEQIIVNDNNSVYAITVNGNVYVWGYNNYGQLGIGSKRSMTKPVKIAGITNVISMIVNNDSAFAFTSDDETFAWGNNAYGKLGIKGAKIITKPVKVEGIVGF